MNFLNPFVKFKIIFLILLIRTLTGSSSSLPDMLLKGFPLIQGFESDFLSNSSSNYSLVFDDEGILFLGQEDRIGIYNGYSWEYIQSKGENLLCRNAANIIFFAAGNKIGYLAADSSNKLVTRSIIDQLPGKYQNFTHVNEINSLGNTIFFHIDNSLLSFSSQQFKVLDENFSAGKIFIAEGKLLCLDQENRLTVYTEDLKSNKFECEIKDICFIIPENDGYLLFDKDNILYKTDLSFNVKSKTTIRSIKQVTHGLSLENGELIISDTSNSLLIIGPDGKVQTKLDEVSELPKSKIIELCNNSNEGIWILQEKSLSLLEYPFTVSHLPGLSKESGNIQDIKVLDNYLYVATTKGVYCRDLSDDAFTPLDISDHCLSLIPGYNCLFAVTANNIYLIRNKTSKTIYKGKILDVNFNFKFQFLYVSSPNGITAIQLKDNEITGQYFYQTESTPLKINSYGDFLWYTDGEGLFTGKCDKPGTWKGKKSGVPVSQTIVDFFLWKNYINIISPGKITTYTTDSSGILNEVSYHLFTGDFLSFRNDTPGNLAILSRNAQNYNMLWYGSYESNTLKSIILPVSIYISNLSFEFIGNSRLIFSTGFDIYDLDLNSYLSDIHDYKTIITGIFTNTDTIFIGTSFNYFKEQLGEKLEKVSFNRRNLKISLSTTNHLNSQIWYQHILEGKDKFWSEWSQKSDIILNNLHEGQYELHIRTKNNLGDPSISTILIFKILTPFYRSRFAILIYIFILSILLFIFYKSSRLNIHKIHAITYSYKKESTGTGIEPKISSQLDSEHNFEFYSTIETNKGKSNARWDKYELVTVLFSDIQGFTKIAESMNPEMLIDELDKFFFHFDSVVEKYNIEKIKTIGDAYMAAGGVPKKNSCNPIEVVLAALEMLQYMKQLKNTRVDIWDLRIGIHSGPVIAGVVGHKKRSYDIWGDTVNTASRMESSGEPGKVNISGITYDLVKEYFLCEYRGKLPVKDKGNIDMYFVKGLRPELSINLAGLPNRKFFTKLQTLRLRDLESIVFTKLETGISKNLFFHTPEFIKHQYEHAGLLSKAENLDADESILILSAALIMNVGLTEVYENYENKSAEFARKILREYKYSEKQIITISNLILATKWPPEPQNILEKILCDIKMDYLGHVDFLKLYKLLFLEENENLKKKLTVSEFKQNILRILEKYDYYSASARRLREVSKDEQMKKVIDDKWE